MQFIHGSTLMPDDQAGLDPQENITVVASPPTNWNYVEIGTGVALGLVGIAAVEFAPVAALALTTGAETGLTTAALAKAGATVAGQVLKAGAAFEVFAGSHGTLQGYIFGHAP